MPSRCPLCGAKTNIEYSDPGNDAPCPKCGHLLLASSHLLQSVTRQFQDVLNTSSGAIGVNTMFKDLGADSLDTVEMIMELEEEFGVSIPDEAAQEIQTIGDYVRYIESYRRRHDE